MTGPNGNPGTCNAVTTQNCADTTYNVFDEQNREVSTTDPSGNQTQYTYDANGTELTKTLGGATGTYTHNGAGQVIEISYSDGTPTVSYQYKYLRDVHLTDDPKEAAVLLDRVIAGCLADEVDEIVSLGNTLKRWRTQILAHHLTGASNGPTEAMNLLVKKIKRLSVYRHGFKSFRNYRLRGLWHCGGIKSNGTLIRLRQCGLTHPSVGRVEHYPSSEQATGRPCGLFGPVPLPGPRGYLPDRRRWWMLTLNHSRDPLSRVSSDRSSHIGGGGPLMWFPVRSTAPLSRSNRA